MYWPRIEGKKDKEYIKIIQIRKCEKIEKKQ